MNNSNGTIIQLLIEEGTTNSTTAWPSGIFLSQRKKIELMAWICLTAAISFSGVLLNIAALIVTTWKGTGESIFNLLMSHFVAINLFICLVNVPIHVFMVLAKRDGYTLNPKVCQSIQFFFAIGCAACNWADVWLSINRLVAIVFPLSYKGWTSGWVNWAMVTFGWVMCTAAILPLSLGRGGSMPLLPMGQCGFLPVGRWGMLITAITAYIPYAIVAGASLAIWVKILHIQRARNHIHMAEGGQAVKTTVISRRRLVVARMLLMTTLWSAVCNIPWDVIQFNFPGLYVKEPVTILWLRTAQVVQYSFSPIILYITNEDYRKRFAVILTRFGYRSNGMNHTINTFHSGTARSSHVAPRRKILENEMD